MARGLLYTLLSLYPAPTRAKAARARRVRPVRPSKATELRYRFALNQVVEQCRRAGEDIAAGMRPMWAVFGHDSVPARDAPPPPPGAPDPAPGLNTLIDHAARRFSGLEQQAERMARLAAQRSLADVDEKLAENLVRSVGVDISSYLAPDEEIGAAMRAAAQANVELIKSIPTQYLDRVRTAVNSSWAVGRRWEDMAADIRAIGSLTERRARLIARDQTSKMNAKFNEVRQTSVGIKEYDWSTAHDERVRPSHGALNGTRQKWSDPPTVDGEPAHPGEPVNCFPADSEIHFAHDVKKAYRRWYSGELAEVVTASGKTLRATPNHPVLTRRGWLAIGELHEGDYVIEVAEEVGQLAEEHGHDRVPSIAQVFATAAGGDSPQSVQLRVDDFHGDGADGQVDVVLAARPLFVDRVTARAQRSSQFGLAVSAIPRLGHGAAALVLFRVLSAAHRMMSSIRKALALWGREALHPQALRLAYATANDASLCEALADYDAVDAQSLRDRQFAFSGGVGGNHRGHVDVETIRGLPAGAPVGLHTHGTQPLGQGVCVDADDLGGSGEGLPFAKQSSRVVKARRFDWSGHVFNLETTVGWYVTNGIVTHNCRCAAIPRIDVADLAPDGEEQREAA